MVTTSDNHTLAAPGCSKVDMGMTNTAERPKTLRRSGSVDDLFERLIDLPVSVTEGALQDHSMELSPDFELNWPGQGQHVEYPAGTTAPLEHIGNLGSSASALG